MRSLMPCAAASLSLLACNSANSPTAPSAATQPEFAAASTYTALDLGTLGGNLSYASAINSAGQVVGTSYTSVPETHAFLWQKGVMTDLGTLGGNFSRAFGINPTGQIVGGAATADPAEATHAFLRTNGIIEGPGDPGRPVQRGRCHQPGRRGRGLELDAAVDPQPRVPVEERSHERSWARSAGTTAAPAFAINPQAQVVGESKTKAGRNPTPLSGPATAP